MLDFLFYFWSFGSQNFSAIVSLSLLFGLDVFHPIAYRKDSADF
jgi:hypothetical protein